MLSNAFSAEFGWTAGPGAEHRHQVRHQRAARRRRSTWAVPAACRRRRSRPTASARRRCRRCVDAGDADGDQPGGHPGRAEPGLRLDRRADRQGQDVLLRHRRLHAAGSDDVPVDHAAGVRAAGGRQSRPTSGTTARGSSTRGVDHKLTPTQTLMVRVNVDRFYDTNPQRRRRRHERADRGAPVHARGRGRRRSITRRCSARNLLNEARVRLPERRSGHAVGGAGRSSTTYTRGGSVPFTIGESRVVRPVRPPGAVRGHAVVVARQAQPALRRQRHPSHVRRHGQRARARRCSARSRSCNTTTAPFDQLTLADVQQYTQPINYGISSYELKQWMSVAFVQDSIRVQRRPHDRPRAPLRPADADRRDERTSRRASASAGIPNGDARLVDSRRLRRCTTRRFAPTRSPAR